MATPTLGLLLITALILPGDHQAVAVPVSNDAEEYPPVTGDVAGAGQKPTVISPGDQTNPQTIIIDVPPKVDAEGATDTSREEVETTHKRKTKSLEAEGTQGNEVPVRQSSLEVAVAAKLSFECARRATSACLKLKLLTYMNRLLKKASIPITDTVEISQTSEDEEELMYPRVLGEDALGEVVAEKVAAFVRTRSLRWKILPEADVLLTPSGDGTVEVGVSARGGRAEEMARRKMKNFLPFFVALKIKLGIVTAMAIAALALFVGKAVLVSSIALLLAGILAIHKVFFRPYPPKKVTYEVVSHPYYTRAHASSSTALSDAGHHYHDGYAGSSYGRSLYGSDIAYRAQGTVNSGVAKSRGVSNYR